MVVFGQRRLGKWLRAGIALTASAYSGCTAGITSGITYPDEDGPDLAQLVITPEGYADPSLTLTRFQFAPKACEGINVDMTTADLDQEDLTRFFAARGLQIAPKKARGDLYWYEIKGSEKDEDPLRLRLAVLPDRFAAAKDLHDSLLQHGPGWWGLRRGNLALLAPKASLGRAVRFALKHRLNCWGMFTYAGVDDAYVVSGSYTEF